MAYLGNSPAEKYISFERQVFTIVNSQTAYTLDHSVTNENDIRLVVNNVVQEPGSGKAYTASGTTLTLSAALTNGTDEMYCVFLGRAVGTVNAPAGSVGTSQLIDLNVTTAKLAGDAVTEAKIADGAVESEHLNANVISGQTELAAEPANTDEFLISDAGVLKRLDYSHIKSSPALELVVAGNSGSDFSLQNCFSSDYNIYYVHLYHGRPAVASTGSGVHMRFLGTSNTEITDSYYWSFNRAYVQSGSNGTSAHVGWNTTFFDLAQNGSSATAQRSWTGSLVVYDPSNSTYQTNFTYQGTYFAYGNTEYESVSGGAQNTNFNYKETTGLKFYQGSSTISQLYYAVYGLKVS